MDTFTTLWNRVQLRVPAAGPDLCQDVVRDSFAQLVERRQWSWLTKSGSFYAPVYTPVGQVSVTSGSPAVTGSATSFTGDMAGRQIQIGSTGGSIYPTYTIVQVTGSLTLMLDRPWTGPTLVNQPYSIFQCYFTAPADFQAFYSVVNPSMGYRLNFNVTQAELDLYDPQRVNSGIAYALAFYDYSQNNVGSVAQPLQVHGTGPSPTSSTTAGFTYPNDSLYVVEITTGGNTGTAIFKWRQDGGITSGNSLVTSSAPTTLSNGVQVSFPNLGSYVLGDVFVISCKAEATSGLPRFELWPRPVGVPNVYSYIYMIKLPALSDDAPVLPPFIAQRGDVLLEMALTQLSLWPGTSNQPNAYRDPNVSVMHRSAAEKLIYELEKKDDDVAIKDLTYEYPYMGPWSDGSWLQSHAVYGAY